MDIILFLKKDFLFLFRRTCSKTPTLRLEEDQKRISGDQLKVKSPIGNINFS